MSRYATLFAAGITVLVAAGTFGGCVKRERVVDVETPIGDVKVDKITDPDGDRGVDVDIDVGRDRPVRP